MNKSRESISRMIEVAIDTAEKEHGVRLAIGDLEHIGMELLSEKINSFLRSTFETFTLRDTLHFISLVEEMKLQGERKKVEPQKKTPPPKAKSKTDAH